ncbi:DUF6114 domain-containing protein [Micromonospora sp. NPDC006766]|uniref:DUF6114 domain-containing protein n=1 Tax=Micromonospora sp. NPDC006766 TaxID=3154778 RepID=UPI0033E59FE0
MTSAETQHVRPGRFGQAWRDFRRWRRTRPFWGGLLTALAGLEIFGSTKMSLHGLTFAMGPTGFLAWLIPAILATCGMLLWFSPQQRMFYSVVAAVTAVYSLIGVNLGGFFIGMLLGMIGSALGFAWVPVRKPAAAGDGPVPDEDTLGGEEEMALVDELLPRQREEETTGVLTDTLPEPRNPLREAEPPAGAADSTQAPPTVGPDTPPGPGRHRDPKLYAILLVLASMSMAGLFALRGEAVALASPGSCPPPDSSVPSPSVPSPSVPSPSASTPDSGSASPIPEPTEEGPAGNLLTGTVDGVTRLLTGGHSASAAVAPSGAAALAAVPAAPAETVTITRTRAATKPARPGKLNTDPCASPAPTTPEPVEVGEPLPRIAAEPGQPRVAARPSKLTGSKVTMTGLRFEGIVELPIVGGTLKCLKFSMAKGVTDDFVLQADGPAGRRQRYVSKQLTVEGNVAFYATRFVGRLKGVKITLTPDLPLPHGVPVTSPVPVTFTDPVIDLAFVDSKTLTAEPALKLDLS